MSTTATTYVRAGLLGLPLYGALTLWAAREPQPNPAEEYEEWARFVTTDEYILTHVLGTGLGLILAIVGTVALGVHLAGTRAARLGLAAMTVAGVGQAILLFFGGLSAFGPPMEGQAYLAGLDLSTLPDSAATITQTLVMLTAITLGFVGNVLLGAAVWRSGDLPRWTGALWVVAAVLMYPLGIVLGAMTTGATPLTVPIGAAIVTAAGVGIVWHAVAPSIGRRAGAPGVNRR